MPNMISKSHKDWVFKKLRFPKGRKLPTVSYLADLQYKPKLIALIAWLARLVTGNLGPLGNRGCLKTLPLCDF